MHRMPQVAEEEHEERKDAPPAPAPPQAAVLALQQSAGNRAVAMLAAKRDDEAAATTAGLNFRGDLAMAQVTGLIDEAEQFQVRATAQMGKIHGQVVAYLQAYRAAHSDITKRLGKAAEEEASRQAMVGAVTGILAGTGVGMVLPRLIDGYRKMRTVGLLSPKAVKPLSLGGQAAGEAAGETIEAGIGAATGQDPGPWKLPPELNSDLLASQEWQKLAEGWRTLAEAAPGITAFGKAGLKLSEALRKASGDELKSILDHWTASDAVGQMRGALTEADDAMAEFTAVLDSPILRKNQYVISQELLIKWMVSLAPGDERDPDNVDADDLDAIDDFESVLAEFNLIAGPFPSPPAESTRLGVDFGDRWTSDADQKQGYIAAVVEKRRLAYIGRLGVVLMRQGRPWVRLAHEAYAVTGRPDPKPNDIEWTMTAYNNEPVPLVEGQVVMVASLGRHWVYVDAVKDAPNVPYGPVVPHPRHVRREEAKRKREEEEKRKREEAAKPKDDGFRDPLQEAIRETEEQYGPFPPWAPPGPEPQVDEEGRVCLSPDAYDGSFSPDDERLDPKSAEACFGAGEGAPAQ